MLENITDRSVAEAHSLLVEGFPARSPAFWRNGLARIWKFHAERELGAVGSILRVGQEAAGVILTLRSKRTAASGRRAHLAVNLSSWYVRPRYRILARQMLRDVLAEPVDLFTDFTPIPSVVELLKNSGFTQRQEGTMLVPLPALALARSGSSRVRGAYQDYDRSLAVLIADHVALGGIACMLIANEQAQPLMFARAKCKGVPAARLVYAADMNGFKENIGGIARYLMSRGCVVLEMPANPDDEIFCGRYSHGRRPVFYKGEMPRADVDQAYSEFVLLGI